jgi:hypothetical protein
MTMAMRKVDVLLSEGKWTFRPRQSPLTLARSLRQNL